MRLLSVPKSNVPQSMWIRKLHFIQFRLSLEFNFKSYVAQKFVSFEFEFSVPWDEIVSRRVVVD